MEIPKEIFRKAYTIINQINFEDYPEDDWVGLSDDWDLNMFIDTDGRRCAVIYPVIDGNTNVQEGFHIQ